MSNDSAGPAADAYADAAGVPASPRRDSEATRRAILDAATDLFCERGYDGAGTRDIAREAGVDARLITRYYGSKENLFAQVVDKVFQKSLMMGPGHNREAAIDLLTSSAPRRDGMMLMLRSASNPRAAEIMRDHLERNYQHRVAEGLPGADAVGRAALLIAVCTGVQAMRNVLHNSALPAGDVARLSPHLEAALDAITYGTAPPAP
ncbi:TetR/AcrR family transcriptional regulator [Micromonospora sp. NPDC050397]|uniref:TetR/AcrR family transcriptional regulator n=1 Tax=Micromonospora sp. NPDC050397 TaxID=3364279 RepID=UPI00384B45E0